MEEKTKIIVVDDHPIFRLGLSELINQERDLVVCGSAETIHDAWKEIDRLQPDMVIADITLREGDGIELVKEAKNRYPKLPVLVLSMHDELLYAERALHTGARGYIMKEEAMETVVKAIRQVLAGKVHVNERVKEHILANIAETPRKKDKSPIQRLTDRELEVFRMIGQGFSTKEIGAKLHLSIKTVGTHKGRIKQKLNIKHANELVRYAVHWEKTGEPGEGAEAQKADSNEPKYYQLLES